MRKKYYDEPRENAAFEICVDVMTELILKIRSGNKTKKGME